MLELERITDLQAFVGKNLGTSEWVAIDQSMIDDFARITGDTNWIHVDTARATRELPGGRTIAHGLLTLSLITHLGATLCRIRRRSKGVNYGSNRVRFINPVLCGARVRLHRSLKAFDPIDGGARVTFDNTVEIEGEARPAMVAESISVYYADEPQ